jgi:hypothetical protein
MLKSVLLIIICAVAFPAFCESPENYEVATIVDVKPHQSGTAASISAVSTYEVSLKVGQTIYLVLYTDTFGTGTVKYVAGREALVHVGTTSITYNDIVGQSHEVPIISRKAATTISQSQ